MDICSQVNTQYLKVTPLQQNSSYEPTATASVTSSAIDVSGASANNSMKGNPLLSESSVCMAAQQAIVEESYLPNVISSGTSVLAEGIGSSINTVASSATSTTTDILNATGPTGFPDFNHL